MTPRDLQGFLNSRYGGVKKLLLRDLGIDNKRLDRMLDGSAKILPYMALAIAAIDRNIPPYGQPRNRRKADQ